MVFEFRLLNDILAKSVTVKAGSFDVVTHERFLMMTAIYGGIPVKWGILLFNIFKYMVTPATRQARGYAVQIRVLLKNAPDLELGESKEFPPLKILTAKTVGTYISKNKNIYVDEDEPVVEKQAEKSKVVSKKRPASTVETPVVKRKRTTGRATPAATDLALVSVAQEAVPIQMISVVTPPAPKRKAPKWRLKLPAGSDDEIVEKEPDVVDVVEEQREKTTTDDVDKILDMVISETAQMETNMEEPSLTRSDDIIVEITTGSIDVNDEDDNLDGSENESARKMASFTAPKQVLKDPLRSGEDDDMSRFKQPSNIIESAAAETDIEPVGTEDSSLAKDVATMADSKDTGPLSKALELTASTKSDEESLSIEEILKHIPADLMLPSVTAANLLE
ncbi:splicing factor 3B subunit 1-like [Dorcoceras hygrometricum]|uniref:Splicing factor 3B subunit 1-like n=1 Tax=Dorcoceras hygrometricum TaxID=472368 RepID=A0A2Z7AP09_9LAMI|nr:splicing factor 3B subunit 1-like [Dorcoceras hygrometricum]